jgi:NAD(P)-dependent dehydrogenase (short-subunit alcohol dehydrogenase family)
MLIATFQAGHVATNDAAPLNCREMPGQRAISSAAHRGADPVEIARAVVWLGSDDASFVLGQTLAIDARVSRRVGSPGKFSEHREGG